MMRRVFWRLYGTGDGPHPDSAADYDAEAVAALRADACIRSGDCCLSAPCPVAQARGATLYERCPWLLGDTAGEYGCQLVKDGDPDILHGPLSVDVGGGCCNPNNLDRLRAGRHRTALRRAGEDPDG